MSINSSAMPTHNCPRCDAYVWRIGLMRDVHMTPRYPWYCPACGYRSNIYVSHQLGMKRERPYVDGKDTRAPDLFGGA